MKETAQPVVPDPASALPKSRQIREMFARIAPTYDLLNRLLSCGVDQRWRRFASKSLSVPSPARILDLCGGTGDFAGQVLKNRPGDKVHVADFCESMLKKARNRFAPEQGVVCGDALRLPFADETFDAAVCGFGVRNWSDLETGLLEARRTLRCGGEFAVLDFFQAGDSFSDRMGRFYVHRILPSVGGMVSGNRAAYQYLADSMDGFCSAREFIARAEDAGFRLKLEKRFILGLCWLLLLVKR